MHLVEILKSWSFIVCKPNHADYITLYTHKKEFSLQYLFRYFQGGKNTKTQPSHGEE